VQVGQKQMGTGADLAVSVVHQDMMARQPRELFVPLPLKPIELEPGAARARRRHARCGTTGAGQGTSTRWRKRSVAPWRPDRPGTRVRAPLARPTVEVEIRTDILFGSGSARADADAEAVIALHRARPWPAFRNAVLVEGHTDDRPIRTARFRRTGSCRPRARRASCTCSRTAACRGPGSPCWPSRAFRPVAPNDSAAGRNANRRVVLVIAGAPSPRTTTANQVAAR
jgi:chemotaxis protein MotB